MSSREASKSKKLSFFRRLRTASLEQQKRKKALIIKAEGVEHDVNKAEDEIARGARRTDDKFRL